VSFAITKTRNADTDGTVPDGAWCEWCGNEGVCILLGTTTIDGITYSRGSAPCLWCDQGTLRAAEWSSPSGQRKGTDRHGKGHVNHHRRLEPESAYSMYDVEPTGPEPRRGDRFTPTADWCRQREQDGCSRGGLWIALGIHRANAWPPEWPEPRRALVERVDIDATIAAKQALALQAKNEAERTTKEPA
jgi:hypothetical protein